MLHSVGAPWLWNEGLEFGSGSSHGQGAVPQEELPKMLWFDSPESQSSSLSFSGASKGNTYIIKYRKLYESKNLNNPLLYIGCTSWLVMDLLSIRKRQVVATPFLILQTKTRGALRTNGKGFLSHRVPVPTAQDAAGTQCSWRQWKFSYVHRFILLGLSDEFISGRTVPSSVRGKVSIRYF